MKEFVPLKNLSENDWLKLRETGIGGSDVGAILGYDKYKTNVQLWKHKTGIEKIKFTGNEATERGKKSEKAIIDLWVAFNKNVEKIIIPEYMYCHDEYEFMRANFDALAVVDGEECVVEIKTAEPQNFKEWNNKIPQSYYCQVLHYLAVSGYKKAYLVAAIKLRMSDDIIIKTYTIERNEAEINYIIEAEKEFYEMIIARKEPRLIKKLDI